MRSPGRYSSYDRERDVLRVDVSGLQVHTLELVDAIFDELEGLSRAYPDRYALICWKDVHIGNTAVAQHYGRRTAAWHKMVRGVVRYAADDPVLRSYIRTEALKHQKDGMRSNLFETEAEALAAIERLREKG